MISRTNFNARSYVENVAYVRADSAFKRHGQNRADFVYRNEVKSGMKMWAHFRSQNLPYYEAEYWLRKCFGREVENTPDTKPEKRSETETEKPGEMWAKSTIDEYKSIVKKVDDYLHGAKSESNRRRQLKNAVDSAAVFAQIKPWFYKAERHGEWISESRFKAMMETCRGIVEQYSTVSALETAA